MKSFRIAVLLVAIAGALAISPAAVAGSDTGTATGAAGHRCPPGSRNRQTIEINLASTGKNEGSGTGLIDASCDIPSFAVAVTFTCVTIKKNVAYASGIGENERFYAVKIVDSGVPGTDEYGVEVSATPFHGANGQHCGAQHVAATPVDFGDFEIVTTGKAK